MRAAAINSTTAKSTNPEIRVTDVVITDESACWLTFHLIGSICNPRISGASQRFIGSRAYSLSECSRRAVGGD
jgi:hypothetical protein